MKRKEKTKITDIKRYSFKYVYLEADHPTIKEDEMTWRILKIVYNTSWNKDTEMGTRNEIDLNDFAEMLKSATEEELIEFITNAKLIFIDEKAKAMYGERGEKYFQAVIPKFYKKYKLLFV